MLASFWPITCAGYGFHGCLYHCRWLLGALSQQVAGALFAALRIYPQLSKFVLPQREDSMYTRMPWCRRGMFQSMTAAP